MRIDHVTLLWAAGAVLYIILALLRAFAISRLEKEQPSDDLKDEVRNYRRKALIATGVLAAVLIVHWLWVQAVDN